MYPRILVSPPPPPSPPKNPSFQTAGNWDDLGYTLTPLQVTGVIPAILISSVCPSYGAFVCIVQKYFVFGSNIYGIYCTDLYWRMLASCPTYRPGFQNTGASCASCVTEKKKAPKGSCALISGDLARQPHPWDRWAASLMKKWSLLD